MNMIETAKKLLGAKSTPTRPVIEKALAETRAESERASNAVVELQERRRDVLLSGDDEAAARHDDETAKEQRAADRAAVLIEELEKKLAAVAEHERIEGITKERKVTEDQIILSVEALKRYPVLAEELRALINTVEVGEQAAAAFNRKHPGEPSIDGPESRVRWIDATPRKELRRERIQLWTYDSTGFVVPEERLDRIFKRGATRGSITSPQSLNRSTVSLREFDRVNFTPTFRGAAPASLARSVVLPSLTPDKPALLDLEHRLPGPVSIPKVETELVPIEAPDANDEAA